MKKWLQQDNASSHCYSYTKKFMIDNKIDLLPNYPPCSSDLNIIENMWSILNDKVRRRGPRNLEELRTIAEEEFSEIPIPLPKICIAAFPIVFPMSFVGNASDM